jgi:hypothetical protein
VRNSRHAVISALDRVFGQVGIAQDPVRDGHAAITHAPGEGVEGLSIAPPGALYEFSLHLPLLARTGSV